MWKNLDCLQIQKKQTNLKNWNSSGIRIDQLITKLPKIYSYF